MVRKKGNRSRGSIRARARVRMLLPVSASFWLFL